MNSSPKVLLADTNRWDLGARLSIGLARIGCTISAVCPANGHTLLVTRAVKEAFPYRASNPLESLRTAIEKADPDIVVPCCDRSVEHLHQLYGNALKRGASGKGIVRLIERSLGDPSGYRIVTSRYDLLSLAQEEGVSVPDTTRVSSSADLDLWRTSKSNACVVKVDGTWGGLGVRTLRELEPSERVWDEVTNTSRLTRAIKRLLVNRDPFFFSAWMNHTERPIIAQKFIGGRPANCTVFAWKGKVVALIAVEVLRSDGSTGPASVVHLIQNAEMRNAAEKIASRLGHVGLFRTGLHSRRGHRTSVPDRDERPARSALLSALRERARSYRSDVGERHRPADSGKHTRNRLRYHCVSASDVTERRYTAGLLLS